MPTHRTTPAETLPSPRVAPDDSSPVDGAPGLDTAPAADQPVDPADRTAPPATTGVVDETQSTEARPARTRRGPRTWFADRGIATKIAIVVMVASLGMVLNGAVGLVSLDATSDQAQSLYADNVVGVSTINRVQNMMLTMQLAVANQAMPRNDSEVTRYTDDTMAAEAELRTALGEYRSASDQPQEIELLDRFEAGLVGYLAVRDATLLPAGASGDREAWMTGRAQAFNALQKADQALTDLVQLEHDQAAAAAAEAAAVTQSSRRMFITVTVWMLALALAIGMVTARAVRGKVLRVQAVAESLQQGDLTATTGVTSRDEVGRMGAALDVAVARLREVVGTIEGSATTLASSARQMSTSSDRIATTAHGTSTQAGVVSAAAEQVSRNIQVVAAASSEMGASVEAIAGDAARASDVARTAVEATTETKQSVHRLGDSSREIGDVVRLITTIAEQTNLLALNATIEAARAGEAGKGFAVVAGEVKELAGATARATEDIARRIEAIQSDTSGAVGAIERVSEIITRIDDYQSSIAGAVEEQRATTGEMTRSIVEAATGSGEIATGIAGVADAAEVTTAGVAENQRAVTDLARMSDELSALVGGFRL